MKKLLCTIALLLAFSSPAFAVCDKSFGGAGGDLVRDILSEMCRKSPYPDTAVPITATNTGTTGATTATLAAVAGKTTYLCGFSIRANATAAATNNATVTGTITGTLNFTQWTAPLASGIGITEPLIGGGGFCIPASAANTAIAVVSGAPGAGGTVSVAAWGFQL